MHARLVWRPKTRSRPGFPALDLSNSGTSLFEITSPAFTAGTFDLVSGDGSVVFGGILDLAFSGGSYADGTDVLQIFANTGSRSGNFSAVNATGLAAGQSATFNPATGTISVVPEPSTYVIAGLSSIGLAGMMRWRKRRAGKSGTGAIFAGRERRGLAMVRALAAPAFRPSRRALRPARCDTVQLARSCQPTADGRRPQSTPVPDFLVPPSAARRAWA
jgi:hypothetical protein